MRTRTLLCCNALFRCFRDRKNTGLHLSRCPAMSPGYSSVTAPSSSRPECTFCTTKSTTSISYFPSIHNYTRYTHASIIFIVLYPSCTHTHHTPTHLRLSLGLHSVECPRFLAFRHHTFPSLPRFSLMQVRKKYHPLTPL